MLCLLKLGKRQHFFLFYLQYSKYYLICHKLTTTFFSGFQLSPRFSVKLVNRSLALRIADVEERDLGLYYCIANVNMRFKVGRGTMLQGKRIFFEL